jgi:hypothetical protein
MGPAHPAIDPVNGMPHIRLMEKSSSRMAKTGQSASLGRAADGVLILRPPVGPKHFTQTQIEKTVDIVRDARTGKFVERPASRDTKRR